MDLTPQQAEILRDAVRKRANYSHGVKVRMNAVVVGPGDSLYDLFDETEKAVNRLVSALHDRTFHKMRPRWE